MSQPTPETGADPDRLTDALPEAPDPWQRADSDGGIVEYVIAAEDGVCSAAKLVVRPELFEDSAVRVDRIQGCQDVGTTRHGGIESAVETVRTELSTATGE